MTRSGRSSRSRHPTGLRALDRIEVVDSTLPLRRPRPAPLQRMCQVTLSPCARARMPKEYMIAPASTRLARSTRQPKSASDSTSTCTSNLGTSCTSALGASPLFAFRYSPRPTSVAEPREQEPLPIVRLGNRRHDHPPARMLGPNTGVRWSSGSRRPSPVTTSSVTDLRMFGVRGDMDHFALRQIVRSSSTRGWRRARTGSARRASCRPSIGRGSCTHRTFPPR
jgi:hypothetical protein